MGTPQNLSDVLSMSRISSFVLFVEILDSFFVHVNYFHVGWHVNYFHVEVRVPETGHRSFNPLTCISPGPNPLSRVRMRTFSVHTGGFELSFLRCLFRVLDFFVFFCFLSRPQQHNESGSPVVNTWHQKRKIYHIPIGSMYGIFTYIWLICMVNVGKYTIHGWYGIYPCPFSVAEKPSAFFGAWTRKSKISTIWFINLRCRCFQGICGVEAKWFSSFLLGVKKNTWKLETWKLAIHKKIKVGQTWT